MYIYGCSKTQLITVGKIGKEQIYTLTKKIKTNYEIDVINTGLLVFSPRSFFRPSKLVWGWGWMGCWFMNKISFG